MDIGHMLDTRPYNGRKNEENVSAVATGWRYKKPGRGV